MEVDKRTKKTLTSRGPLSDRITRMEAKLTRLEAEVAKKDLATAQKDVNAATTLGWHVHGQVKERLDGETPTVDANKEAVNRLNGQWQIFAVMVGPTVVQTTTAITNAATTGLGILTTYVELLQKVTKTPADLAAFMANPIAYTAGKVGFGVGNYSAQIANTMQSPVVTTGPVNINVSGAGDPNATASAVANRLRDLRDMMTAP